MGFQRGTERLRSLDVECFCESVRGGTGPCDPPAGDTGSVYPSSSARNTLASTRNTLASTRNTLARTRNKLASSRNTLVSTRNICTWNILAITRNTLGTWNTLEDTFKQNYAYILKRALIPYNSKLTFKPK